MKTYSKCHEAQPFTEFGKDKNRPDGLNTWCKGCRREYRQTTRKVKNRKAQRERGAAFRAWLASMEEGQSCLDCDDVYALHVMEGFVL